MVFALQHALDGALPTAATVSLSSAAISGDSPDDLPTVTVSHDDPSDCHCCQL